MHGFFFALLFIIFQVFWYVRMYSAVKKVQQKLIGLKKQELLIGKIEELVSGKTKSF
jgi:hypothetical protein